MNPFPPNDCFNFTNASEILNGMVMDATDGGCRLNKVVEALEALVTLTNKFTNKKKAKESEAPSTAVSLLIRVVDEFVHHSMLLVIF